MSAMSRQFVLELEFKVKRHPNHPEKQLVIVDEGSITELSKLREDLGNFTTEPFIIQYLDEDNDLVSIDTDEEFKEFTKCVMQRSSKGEVQKIILCSTMPDSEGKQLPNQKSEKADKPPIKIYLPKDMEKAKRQWTAFALRECFKRIYAGGAMNEWQAKCKSELKREILSEMKEELGAAFQPNAAQKEFDDYDEDSDGNMVCRHEKKKMKLNHNFKRLDKKEKHFDKKKIDQRIEKLELKKKKLMEKAYLLRAAYKSVTDTSLGRPLIMSAIATSVNNTGTRDVVALANKVAVGKPFTYTWRIVNDGTVSWTDVQLQHVWSTHGLEPEELLVKCAPLNPGQKCFVRMKFKAPSTVGPFVTFWHFVHVIGPHLKQFGHYVALNGYTKLSDDTPTSGEQAEGQNDHEMTDTKRVSFKDEVECLFLTSRDGKTNAEDEMTIKKHLDASLASAEIAAEMAREAANAALRAASSMRTDKSELLSELDQVIKNCQELRLESSESDGDVNIDVNEEADPGFVMVDIPSCSSTEQNKQQAKNNKTVNMDLGEEEKKTNVQKNLDIDELVRLHMDHMKNEQDGSKNSGIDKQTTVPKEVIEVAQEVSEPPPFDPVAMSYNLNLNNEGPHVQKSYTKLPEEQHGLHMGYPNVSYPMMGPPPRVAMAMYPPQQHPAHAYPLFAPQTSSSHGIVFPPPPMNYIPTPKINPPPHYPHPQIPIPLPFPNCMAPPAVPLHPATFQSSPIAPEFKFSPIQQHVCSEDLSVPNPFFPEPISPPFTETITNVGNQNENPNLTNLTEQATAGSLFVTNVTTENGHAPTQGNSGGDATVQILPQGLVDGAINVASTAYSHAWNALNNLRPKECLAQEFDPVFENNMALLYEMGFRNVERNARLLKRFKNDINQVIGVICGAPPGSNLEID